MTYYFVAGAMVVYLLSIPHRRNRAPHVPVWAWLLTGVLWPLAVLVFLVMTWQAFWVAHGRRP